MKARLDAPWLGANPMDAAPPESSIPVHSDDVGYIRHIDIARMNKIAEREGLKVYIVELPGSFLYPSQPFALVEPGAAQQELSEDITALIADCLTVGTARSFDQDPAFGLIAMSEIAQRALSPGVNDPGTAIAVLGRLVRVLSIWSEPAEPDIAYPRLWVPPLTVKSVLIDAVQPISRDSAGNIEVQIHIQKALRALAAHAPGVFGNAAAEQSRTALDYAQSVLEDEGHRAEIRRIASPLLQFD